MNWASKIDMASGKPVLVDQFGPGVQGADHNTKNVCPAALGSKDEQPATYSPKSHMFFVPTNHVCMDYEPFKVSYTAGQPFVGATLSMYPPTGQSNLGNMIAYDVNQGRIAWSDPETFSVWSGALSTAGDVVAYGTLDGNLKVVEAKTGKRSTSSRHRPASSATSTPTPMAASSIWPFCPVWAAGPASAWRPD